MILRVRDWYASRTKREQHLLLLMLAIAVPLLVWLLIVRPVTAAYDDALEEHLKAVDRRGRVIALADAAKTRPALRTADVGVELPLIVTETAAQAGIALQGANPNGPNAVDVTVSGSPAAALGQWLRAIEARGITVQELRMTPLPEGSVNMSARVTRG